MKKILFILFYFLYICTIQAQNIPYSEQNKIQKFTNPIFPGDYPDPSILRDGDNYYIVHSSFEYYPGLLIWQSKDLINWTPIVNTLHTYVGSVWAPDLVKYNNKYYIYFPANNKNYVITADSINGKWSNPIELAVEGIDPGHIVDSKGNRYLYFSHGGYVQLSKDGLTVTSPIHHVYNGWQIPREWSIECFCMEGPKITKHGDYYYLTVAEGGTAGPPTSHMIISARSKSPLGPWENSPYNPILRTKSVNEQWWSKGHGTLFEDIKGKYWMVFHAYENGYYGMGRQTMLLPVEWTKDGWFYISDSISTEKPIESPHNTLQTKFPISDTFHGNSLNPHWKFWGEFDTSRFTVENNSIKVQSKGSSVGDCSPLLYIPTDHSYTADVEIEIQGNAIGGLVLFYNTNFYSGILADTTSILANLRGWQFPTEKNVMHNHVFLRIQNTKNIVDMFYSIDGTHWEKIENSVDVSGLHHNVLGGFLSLRIGLCSIGNGSVTFKNFNYTPISR